MPFIVDTMFLLQPPMSFHALRSDQNATLPSVETMSPVLLNFNFKESNFLQFSNLGMNLENVDCLKNISNVLFCPSQNKIKITSLQICKFG